MANYAKVVDGYITQVIVADASFFEHLQDTSPGDWVLMPDDVNCGIGDLYCEESKQFSICEARMPRYMNYPPVQDQLLAIWNSMDSGEIPASKAFYNLIKEVNDKYSGTHDG